MKKRDKKMQIHRETLRRLEPADLTAARGGEIAPEADTGRWSSCGRPNCCDDTLNGTF
jgi:hypothetical protein